MLRLMRLQTPSTEFVHRIAAHRGGRGLVGTRPHPRFPSWLVALGRTRNLWRCTPGVAWQAADDSHSGRLSPSSVRPGCQGRDSSRKEDRSRGEQNPGRIQDTWQDVLEPVCRMGQTNVSNAGVIRRKACRGVQEKNRHSSRRVRLLGLADSGRDRGESGKLADCSTNGATEWLGGSPASESQDQYSQ